MVATTRRRIGREAALALCSSRWWEGKTHREIAEFQITTEELCCPFSVFHEAIEKALGRGVYTHEFGLNWDGLLAELFGAKDAPSFHEILDLIPKDKRVLVVGVESGS